MKRRVILIVLGLLAGPWACGAGGNVVVIENRAEDTIEFAMRRSDGSVTSHKLAKGDVLPISTATAIEAGFRAQKEPRRYTLRPNTIHYFMVREGKLNLFQLAFPQVAGLEEAPGSNRDLGNDPNRIQRAPAADAILEIPVMLMHDDSEPLVQSLWEKKVRQRLSDASDIFERHCRVRFQVAAVGSWVADKELREFEKSIEGFQRKVRPAPARLAIGFTSHYKWEPGEKHLGGIYGPLCSHILVREALRNVSEPERLEVLVHELGHFLGAVHSPDPNSVMRPLLGDQKSRRRGFRIGFDAPNTLAMHLIADELRTRPLAALSQLPPPAKTSMRSVYTMLRDELPKDPAAPKYLALLDLPSRVAVEPAERIPTAVAGARVVVQAVMQAALQNQQRPSATEKGAAEKGAAGERAEPIGAQRPKERSETPASSPHRLTGDELTNHYVRAAAAAARPLPKDTAPTAFLLGLGVALDKSALLREAPLTARLWRSLESDAERKARLAAIGEPTVRARQDLLQHFAVSAALTALVGPQGAELAGMLKEVADAKAGSGFSFQDLAADLAGVEFALGVQSRGIPLATLADSFRTQDYVPELTGLKEGLSRDEFARTHGGLADQRFQLEVRGLRQRIRSLPGHKEANKQEKE